MQAPPASVPAYGALAALMKDNHYWFGPSGFLFTSPWVVTPHTVRHSAVLLLTASGEPFEVTAGGSAVRSAASAVAPLTERGLCAMNVGLVSLHVFPPHPCYRAFQRIAAPGIAGLDRRRFAEFDAGILRAYEGRLTLREAQQLFEALVGAAVQQLPRAARGALAVDRLHEMLREKP